MGRTAGFSLNEGRKDMAEHPEEKLGLSLVYGRKNRAGLSSAARVVASWGVSWASPQLGAVVQVPDDSAWESSEGRWGG